MTFRYLFTDTDREHLEREARARVAEWEGRTRPQDYPDTPSGHYVGAAGEFALERFLDEYGVDHEPDTASGSTWDRLAGEYAFEVKTRQAAYYEAYGRGIAEHTVAAFATRTRVERPVVVLAKFEGVATRELLHALAVTLTGWESARDVWRAPKVLTVSASAENYCHVIERPLPMHALGEHLRQAVSV